MTRAPFARPPADVAGELDADGRSAFCTATRGLGPGRGVEVWQFERGTRTWNPTLPPGGWFRPGRGCVIGDELLLCNDVDRLDATYGAVAVLDLPAGAACRLVRGDALFAQHRP